MAVKGIIRPMSEETIGSTQPTKATQPNKAQTPNPVQEEGASTQEIKSKPKKTLRGRIGRFFLNLLIFLVIIGLGIFGGYQSGIKIRTDAQTALDQQQLSDQFSRALVDIQFGNYGAAQQRLEYIIGIDPSFPGAMDKLTQHAPGESGMSTSALTGNRNFLYGHVRVAP